MLTTKLGEKEKTKFRHIFETMEYGTTLESTDDAQKWVADNYKTNIQSKLNNGHKECTPYSMRNVISSENDTLCTVYIADDMIVEEIRKTIESKNQHEWKDLKSFQRTKIMLSLASEIQANVKIFVQLEILARGILAKNTRNCAIPLLVEYFQYYSNFTGFSCVKNQPNYVVANIFSDCSLTAFGMILGPALASGRNVLLIVEPKISLAAALLLELAHKAGLPEDVLTVVVSQKVAQGSLKALCPQKTSMIVFDNADINSACDSVVQAAWGRHGTLFSSVDTILIQERIFGTFVGKLKRKMRSIRVGFANETSVDIAYPSNDGECVSKLKKIVNTAKSQSLEVYQNEECINEFTPTLVIGGKVSTNNVIIPLEDGDVKRNGDNAAPVVYVLPFRTISEGIALANNSKQDLGVSVWTENIGTAGEVARNLKVNNVWINSHYLTSVDIPLKQYKGDYCFGGKDGMFKFDVADWMKFELNQIIMNNIWTKLGKCGRTKIFNQFADNIIAKYSQFKKKYSEEYLDKCLSYVYECLQNTHEIHSGGASKDGHCVTVYREPKGRVTISFMELSDLKLLLIALFEGNSVDCFHKPQDACLGLIEELNLLLPKNVLKLIPAASLNHETRCHVNGPGGNWESIRLMVTSPKNVWNDIGQSSQFRM